MEPVQRIAPGAPQGMAALGVGMSAHSPIQLADTTAPLDQLELAHGAETSWEKGRMRLMILSAASRDYRPENAFVPWRATLQVALIAPGNPDS
jgi:hypothetical protein